jgi:twitching motility protein PilU
VLLNTKLISELIEKGDFSGVKEAMEQSMAEGSQTFEQDIARLIIEGAIDKKEGLAYADSPTNLQWRLQNNFAGKDMAHAEEGASEEDMADEPSFTEITLDVKH